MGNPDSHEYFPETESSSPEGAVDQILDSAEQDELLREQKDKVVRLSDMIFSKVSPYVNLLEDALASKLDAEYGPMLEVKPDGDFGFPQMKRKTEAPAHLEYILKRLSQADHIAQELIVLPVDLREFDKWPPSERSSYIGKLTQLNLMASQQQAKLGNNPSPSQVIDGFEDIMSEAWASLPEYHQEFVKDKYGAKPGMIGGVAMKAAFMYMKNILS